METSVLDLIAYYQNLLIIQYASKTKAKDTIGATVTPILMPQTSVQEVSFGLAAPTSGSFVLSYDGTPVTINWDDSEATIQTKLRTIPALAAVVVSGSPAALSFTVTFDGVAPPPALLLVVDSTTLDTGYPTVAEIDETLPIAIQNAFNLTGDNVAVGVQLDVLGKYAGVSRTGQGFTEPITLDDADFLTLITMAIIKNTAGSSLATITALIYQFFGTHIQVTDYKNMRMSYVVDYGIGSADLVELFVSEGLLPKPMGVALSAIYAPTVNLYGFRTYVNANPLAYGFNTYTSYDTTHTWVSYSNAIIAP